jgi:hypothetical protein
MGKCTSPFLFGIRAVDKYGNRRKTGHDIFRVSMTHTSSASSQPLQGLVTDNNDGTYPHFVVQKEKGYGEKKKKKNIFVKFAEIF